MYNAGMNKIVSHIFDKRKPDFSKLENFGFEENNGEFSYKTKISNGQFALCVTVKGDGISTEVTDTETGEEYLLFLVDGAEGSFVGEVRADYERVLSEIAEKCFVENVFRCEYTQSVADYAREKYGNEVEFLWKDDTEDCVLRRADNRKWYAAILTVSRDKLGFSSKEKVEVLDLRTDPETIDSAVDGKRFFYGYHMNKRHWISVILDGTVGLEKIFAMIDESYEIAGKAK